MEKKPILKRQPSTPLAAPIRPVAQRQISVPISAKAKVKANIQTRDSIIRKRHPICFKEGDEFFFALTWNPVPGIFARGQHLALIFNREFDQEGSNSLGFYPRGGPERSLRNAASTLVGGRGGLWIPDPLITMNLRDNTPITLVTANGDFDVPAQDVKDVFTPSTLVVAPADRLSRQAAKYLNEYTCIDDAGAGREHEHIEMVLPSYDQKDGPLTLIGQRFKTPDKHYRVLPSCVDDEFTNCQGFLYNIFRDDPEIQKRLDSKLLFNTLDPPADAETILRLVSQHGSSRQRAKRRSRKRRSRKRRSRKRRSRKRRARKRRTRKRRRRHQHH